MCIHAQKSQFFTGFYQIQNTRSYLQKLKYIPGPNESINIYYSSGKVCLQNFSFWGSE